MTKQYKIPTSISVLSSMRRTFYVYILASRSKALYIGITNDLSRRLLQHQFGKGSQFARKYRAVRLLYAETTTDVRAAIQREKQLKGWVRRRKVELIERLNPEWHDLASG